MVSGIDAPLVQCAQRISGVVAGRGRTAGLRAGEDEHLDAGGRQHVPH